MRSLISKALPWGVLVCAMALGFYGAGCEEAETQASPEVTTASLEPSVESEAVESSPVLEAPGDDEQSPCPCGGECEGNCGGECEGNCGGKCGGNCATAHAGGGSTGCPYLDQQRVAHEGCPHLAAEREEERPPCGGGQQH